MTATMNRPVDTSHTTESSDASTTPVRTTAARFGLSDDDLEAFGRELDALRDRVRADLGQDDVDYMRRIIKIQKLIKRLEEVE